MHTYKKYISWYLHTIIGAVYFTLANLDPGQRSKLEAIHLVSLFHYSLLNAHSFDEVLRPLVRDVKDLQEVSSNTCCM